MEDTSFGVKQVGFKHPVCPSRISVEPQDDIFILVRSYHIPIQNPLTLHLHKIKSPYKV